MMTVVVVVVVVVTKLYIHKVEWLRENEMHKIRWDLAIQIDLLIEVRKPNLLLKKEEFAIFKVN